MVNNVCAKLRFLRYWTMFPKIAVYFGRENGEIFYDSITLWAVKEKSYHKGREALDHKEPLPKDARVHTQQGR